jgi:N-acetylneuraminic acid mutarotase
MPAFRRRVPFPYLVFLAALGACGGTDAPTEPAASPVAAEAEFFFIHDVWTRKPDLPAARYGAVAAAVDKVVYIIGGYNEYEQTQAGVRAWDVSTGSTGSWVAKAPMPGKRGRANGATVINGKIYVPGGENATGGITRSLFVYDPAADSWSTKAQMPAAGQAGGSVAINGKLYVVTRVAGEEVSSLFRYNPGTNSWTERAAAPADLSGAVLGVIDGKLYAAGAYEGFGVGSKTLYMYDPVSDSWSAKASMPEGHGYAAGKAVEGKLYVAGGWSNGGGATRRLDVYDPATDSWSQRKDMLVPAGMAGSASVGRILYVLGGLGPKPLVVTQGYLP